MEHGVLRVSESAEAEIEASRAFVTISVSSQKLVFGNAALTAAEEIKTVVDKIREIDQSVEVDTQSVSIGSGAGPFGKNSSAAYVLKLTVADLGKLGAILGACSEGKKVTVLSLRWDYEDEPVKLRLIQEAVKKSKAKADQMMAAIGYAVTGIRSCSDSYVMPNIAEIILGGEGLAPAAMPVAARAKGMAAPALNIGAQFTSKKTVTATFTAEFLVAAMT